MTKELIHIKYFNSNGKLRAEIQEDPFVGFYLYIYDTQSGECFRDHLQDDLETVLRQGEEDYQIPKNAWKKTSQN